jgi:multiple sugar transport system substrate-binding protein
MHPHRILILLTAGLVLGCGAQPTGTVVVFPASAVGKEAEILGRQIDRFHEANPDVRVELRQTPDAAGQRHQLYVQWLNAWASQPDVLQLDVIWTPEFAAAGWILPLDRYGPDVGDFFPATVRANRWEGGLYALPWFVDVGMLYYRTDLVEPPARFDDLTRLAARAQEQPGVRYGLLWQGARYEGLVCVFLEHLGGFGGTILDERGRVVVDSDEAVQALTFMRDSVYRSEIVPEDALGWQEEQTRFRFQNGEAAFMRNWPYAFALMQDSEQSQVAGKYAVTVMPASASGSPTAALGGSQLAINARTRHPEAAYRVIEFMTRPEQMLERARVAGQYPARQSVYDNPELARALPIPVADVRRIIRSATPRPVTPVYTELSGILQIALHRALTHQAEPRPALENAARQMRELLDRVGLSGRE